MLNEDYGHVRIKLKEFIQDKDIKKGKLAFKAEMQRTQLNKWIRGEIAYIDLAVLARLCKALGCRVEDLLEYVEEPQEK